MTVWGSMQCPYYVHKALVKLFDLPAEKVRIIQTETGGGFGGKEEYPSLIAGHAALLAWKSGKPVKIIYDRAEDMVATTKRHPSRTRHKTAVTKDGKVVTGRRINEDTYSVQLIDEQERLVSLSKDELREYTVAKTASMPAYKNTLSATEISDVVAYLLSLKGL